MGQGSSGEALSGLSTGDPGPGEGLVVDQADLFEAVQQPGRERRRDLLLLQLVGKLLAAARLAGQGVEKDLAGDRLVVGLWAVS